MRKKIIQKETKLVSILKHVKQNGFLPFTEKPSVERDFEKEEEKDSLNASDLFSIFTANIIKEEVIFTR